MCSVLGEESVSAVSEQRAKQFAVIPKVAQFNIAMSDQPETDDQFCAMVEAECSPAAKRIAELERDCTLIKWVQKFEATVGPYLDERGGCAGWIAGCPSFVGWGRGDNWREAVQSLMEMMKNETTEDAKNRQGLAKASGKPA